MKSFARMLCTVMLASACAVSWAQVNQVAPYVSTSTFNGYLSAHNLNTYISVLKADRGRVGEFYFAEAKAREECAVFSIDPSYAERAIHGLEDHPNTPHAKIMMEMFERLQRRCAEFPQAGRPGQLDVVSAIDQATLHGNVPAAAFTLVTGSSQESGVTVRDRAIKIINTKNPEAIFEISTLFGNGSLVLKTPVFINRNESAIAWRVVACKLGLDCSYSSALVQQACLTGGPCGTSGYVENIRSDKVSPSQFDQIDEAVKYIMGAIQDGSVHNIIITGAHPKEHEGITASQPFLGPPVTREPPPGDDDDREVDLSNPKYSYIQSTGINVNSDYSLRVGTDTAADYGYDQYHGINALKMGQTFKVKYKDGSEETAIVTLPQTDGSSVAAAPIPGSQVGGGSDGTAPGGVIIIPVGTAGSTKQWACVGTGSGDNEVWTCTYE